MNETATLATKYAEGSPLQISASHRFTSWLEEQKVSLAFSTYEAGKLFLVGRKPEGQLGIFERTFNRCMGLWSNGQTLWLSSLFQLWRFENVLAPGEIQSGFDRLYVPRIGYTTGDIDVHDVAVDARGRAVFINTLFSCLATTNERYSFSPLWRPPFVSKLAAEDRCHLNGLAMDQGKPRYATACSQSDVVEGWRDHRTDGGCVIDIESDEIVADGLSMPHSPRLYRDRLWLLNSGAGEFGYLDMRTGKFEPVAFCCGYVRGLAFAGDFAVLGLSAPREKTFAGLPLDDRLAERSAVPRCGLQVVDLTSGDIVHWMRIEGVIRELYDVAALPGVTRPKALGFKTDEIQRNVRFEEAGSTESWTCIETA